MTAPDELRRERTTAASANQRTAADPAISAWVAASAGSGKTRVLTERVLRLMLEGARPERILCLTFTKAAAAEMATRLSGELAVWATASDQALEDKLHALLGGAPSADLQARARRLFAEVIDVPGGMKIQTIHAFCQSLLGRFPLEAGVAPHFALIEERSAAELLQSAREEVFHRLQSPRGDGGGALARAMEVIATQVADQDFPKLLAALLKERGRVQAILDRHAGHAGLSLAIDDALGLAHGETRDGVLAAACEQGAFNELGLRRVAATMLESSKKTDVERGALLAAWLEDPESRAGRLDDYCKAFFTKGGKGPRIAKFATKEVLDRLPQTPDIAEAETARLEALRDRLNAFEIAEATKALFALAQEVFQVYERRKAALGLLDYDDLILKARALLERSGQAAWVLFKLDGGLDHLLIDEAQDTNPDQWRVVKALSEEFFAGEGAHEERDPAPRTVFAVGDAKQSIFSFQRADPDAFVSMQGYFSERVQASGHDWRPVDLTVSFRSTATVLQAVDRVFAFEAHQAGLIFGARWEDHLPVRAGQAGLVELWPEVGPLEVPEMEPWAPPVEVLESASGEHRLAQGIAARIAAWLAAESREALPEAWLDSKDRRIEAGDIMILVRRRNVFVAEMVRALKDRNIPVAGVDRMVLTEQLAVMDLIALGKTVLLPEDDLTLAMLLRSPLIGLSEDALFELAYGRGEKVPLWSALRDKAVGEAGLAEALEKLEAWRDLADFTPPYEFFAAVLNGGGRRALLGRLGPDADDPIEEFLNQALAYEAEHPPSLQGFLHWITAGAQEVKRDLEQAGGAVRVMTVHGAKGLQAPVVFLPDTTAAPEVRERVFWLDAGAGEPPLPLWLPRVELAEATARRAREAAKAAQEREYRRLLYVAMTRAEDRLYLCGWGEAKEGSWYAMVREALAEQATPFAFDSASPQGWSGEGLRLMGSQEVAPEPKPPRRDPAQPAAKALPAWMTAPPPPEPAPPRPLAPSRPSEAEPPALSPLSTEKGRAEEARRYQRGRVIHRLLELLPEVAPAQREETAWKLLGPEGRGLPEEAQAALITETLAVLDHPEFAPIFGPGSRAEAPVAGLIEGKGGPRPVSGQLDRILVTTEKVLVVDYKSNRPPPRRESEIPSAYLRQMAAYRALLARIYPDREIACSLLWTDAPCLMQLSPEALDAHAP